MRSQHHRLLWRLLACCLIAPGGIALATDRATSDAKSVRELRCSGGIVVVRSSERTDAAIACDAARDALSFLHTQGLQAPADIMLEIAHHLPEVVGPSAAGCYVERERRVVVLPYAKFKEFGTWFELPVDRGLYRSLIAHEVAHAVGACNFKVAQPSIQAKEYIAYVTMFATMEPELRARALSKFPGEGFENEAQMGSLPYMMDPMRFGVKSYKHFLKPENGRVFFDAILAGRVLVE